jgi:hypothetical protein
MKLVSYSRAASDETPRSVAPAAKLGNSPDALAASASYLRM